MSIGSGYYSSNNPGLLSFVRCNDCSCRHSSTFFGSPLNNTSGTFQPRKSAGLVYTGGANKLSWKESKRAEVSSFNTPGNKRPIASTKTAAANSPPLNT